ncbi:MAG: hypothetical protein ACRDRY_20860 [Pseudonocardiaceae bacterium]
MNASFASHERRASCKFCVAHALDPTDAALIQEDRLREFEATSPTQSQKYFGNTVDRSLVDIDTFTGVHSGVSLSWAVTSELILLGVGDR